MNVKVSYLTMGESAPQETPMGPIPGTQVTVLAETVHACKGWQFENAGSDDRPEVVLSLYSEEGTVASYSWNRVVTVMQVG